jgi:hypothetical protein
MKNKLSRYLSTGLAGILALVPTLETFAADHGDAPALAHDQAADVADVYCFLDPKDNTQTVLIATFHGFIVPGEASNFGVFDPAARYRFEIYNDHVNLPPPVTAAEKSAFLDKIVPRKTIDVTFSPRVAIPGPAGKENLQVPQPQKATVTFSGFRDINNEGVFRNLPTTNPSLGTTASSQVVTDIATGVGKVKFFAGEVDDPFFFDIPAFSAFIGSVRNGAPDVSVFNRRRDSFAGYNVLSIALRIPTDLLVGKNGSKIGVDFLIQRHDIETLTSTGTTRGFGAFQTVDRLGVPAVNVALIPFNTKNDYNTGKPRGDAAGNFAGSIVGTLQNLGTDSAHIGILANVAVTYGDILRLETNPAIAPNVGHGGGGNANGFPNGRRLRDDVVDTLLLLISNEGLTTGDGVDASDLAPNDSFPFLHEPQQPRANGVTDDNTRN